MWVREIVEARLPIRRPSKRSPNDGFERDSSVLDVARGNYAAFIAVMDPKDFIRLTTTSQAEYDQIFQDEFLDIDAYKRDDHPRLDGVNNYHLPFLWVSYPDGHVVGHEGRHRAAMVAKAGGDKFPVVIYFKMPLTTTVTYEKEDRETWEYEDYTRTFRSYDEAEAFIADCKRLNDDPNHPYAYSRFRTAQSGGNTLKGHPDRSEGWDYAAWKTTDMPEHLIGQFDKSVVVPTSRMKVGVVKGYSHFRR